MATTMCMENCTDAGILYEIVYEELWGPWSAAMDYFEYQPWFFSLLGSFMVGLSGVLPLFVIPIDEGLDLKNGAGAGTLKMLLSFAVGGLLGDVFLHLLPEAWGNKSLNAGSKNGHPSMACGLWVLTGFLVFIIAEKVFCGVTESQNAEEEEEVEEEAALSTGSEKEEPMNNNVHKEMENNNCLKLNNHQENALRKNGFRANGIIKEIPEMINYCELVKDQKNNYAERNGLVKKQREADSEFLINSKGSAAEMNGVLLQSNRVPKPEPSVRKDKPKHISGYLNLLANSIDNFTHGLAVGGSFLVSFRLGALTTLAILVHEIPHEVGDFAILLKSGFSRWDAAKAQLLTAGGGIFGALMAVMCSGGGIEARTSWILPFTAGGFLHIGLVTVLPELLLETDPKESLKQLGALLLGISLMAFLTALCD